MTPHTVGPVRILAGAADEHPKDGIILRGVVAMDSLRTLQVDDYQREAAPLTSLSSILEALEKGESLPDIVLGMRGERYDHRTKGEDIHFLRDPVYIVDGQQRVNACIHYLSKHPDAEIRLGAMIHFGTTKEWERKRFRTLNTLRAKVSPNVILRNMRDDNVSVATLYNISLGTDKAFPLHDRVSWSQRMARGELISALTFAKVTGLLHAHKAPTRRTKVDELVPALDKALEIFGVQAFRGNVKGFFNLIDECWGIRRIQYREGAAYIKGSFLSVLSALLSDHTDFWRTPDEKTLTIEAPLRRKIAQFPMHDPQIINLASAGGKSREILYNLLRDHINSGKRTKRLKSRNGDSILFANEGEEETESPEALVTV